MDVGVGELVLFLTVEHNAVLIDEVEHSHPPFGRAKELHKQIVLPFLHSHIRTLSSFSFFFGFFGSYFFFPKSQSSIIRDYIAVAISVQTHQLLLGHRQLAVCLWCD